MRQTGNGQPRFFWRGALILLPLMLLAGMGIYSLRQDRRLAEIEARERCQGMAENYARAIALALQKPPPAAFSEITLDGSGNLLAVGGSRSRARMPAAPVPRPLWTSALTESQRTAWKAARAAESAQRAEAGALFKKFIDMEPPKMFLASARYALALQCARNHDSAAEQWFALVENTHGELSEGGLPLDLLAQYQRWKLDGARPDRAEALCSNALEHPTLISPVLLACGNPKWLAAWHKDEAAREFYECAQPVLKSGGGPWVRWRGEDWLSLASSNTLAAAPRSFAESAVAASEPSEQRQAAYAQPEIELAGMKMTGGQAGPLLASARAAPNVAVSECLARPAMLYARARTRTEWFAALILASAAAAAAGLVSAFRGFDQQRRLSALKTNFVSSVSHELRAPIASMRLLAESLERGKIADAAKQKQYFGLLVQESRRLAMLIDNILDFSRIERGGKKYEFEPADTGALAEDTVQLMRPCAAERQVELVLRNDGGQGARSFSCDGLALQQALINLIDNAVKHSPPGGQVAVGLDGGAEGLKMWVEDNGPGLPAEEHGKIFEPFYRRGSELRRETQGIGIGLTIVQHIVEAHGGRVTVRSAPGQGSRFTMELPRS
ncbi:MAG TPA: HAMP domain-containing sensor histidine kinase [Verrucomicrobiae bacterium]|jgi:signal transduction histidine kinase